MTQSRRSIAFLTGLFVLVVLAFAVLFQAARDRSYLADLDSSEYLLIWKEELEREYPVEGFLLLTLTSLK